jgi:hypothetical protein
MIKDNGTEEHCRPLATYENQVYFTAAFVSKRNFCCQVILNQKTLFSKDIYNSKFSQRISKWVWSHSQTNWIYFPVKNAKSPG